MYSSLTRKFTHAFLMLALTIGAGSARAEDTEIYFGGGSSGSTIRPNVLFIFDTSISMFATVPGTSPSQSRLTVMKEAVVNILNDLEDVNVGMMRFTHRRGGPILFPIKYIEDNIADIPGETAGAVGNIEYENQVAANNNDAEESNTTNVVTTSDVTLEITDTAAIAAVAAGEADVSYRVPSSSNDAEEVDTPASSTPSTNSSTLDVAAGNNVGLRFTGVTIPPNSDIVDARLNFWVRTYQSVDTDVTISVQNVDDSSSFTTVNNNLTGRTWTGAVAWNDVTAAAVNTSVASTDISSLIEAIVQRGCTGTLGDPTDTTGCSWTSNNSMAFKLHTTSSDNRQFYSYDSGFAASRHPRLDITYATPEVIGVPGTSQTVGLRFEDIKVPQGATMVSASLSFTPVSDKTGSSTWIIRGHKVADSPSFTTTNGNITDRLTAVTASATWVAPNWTAEIPVETTSNGTSSLTAVMQELVNQADWCGGNAISLIITAPAPIREAYSFDGDPDLAPVLTYAYDGDATTTGCYAEVESAQTAVSADDAEQYGTAVDTIDNDLDLGYDTETASDQTVGLRFQGMDIPQGATITEASIEFSARGISTGAADFVIKGENEDDTSLFTTTANDITSRDDTTAAVTWTPEDWDADGGKFDSADIKTIIQEIVNRAGWASGNSIVITIAQNSGSGTRIAESWNGDPAKGPRLTVSYSSDATQTAFKSVRERMIELVNGLPKSDNTPIPATLYEAARYWRGQNIDYGKTRDLDAGATGDQYARLSHPGSYCTADNACGGANTTTYPPYGRNTAACDGSDASTCASQKIEGTPTYISPFNSSLTCQSNYQVLLTDGEAAWNDEDESVIQGKIKTLTGAASCLADNSSFVTAADIASGSDIYLNYNTGQSFLDSANSELCTVDLIKYMKENDQSTATLGANIANDQTVSTYTIAFNLSAANPVQYLKDIANVGGGEFFSATTAGDLVSAFTTIVTDVKSDPTSFVSPSLATNAFNRLLSRDEIYFGLFTPGYEQSWPGNVKKYNICVSSGGDDENIATTADNCTLGEILDYNDDPAIDSTTEKFKDTATSEWSNDGVNNVTDDGIDGRETTLGGSGGQITDYTKRIIYTDTATAPSSGTALNTAGRIFSQDATTIANARWNHADLAAMRTAICPNPSTDTATANGLDCQARMYWLLGKIYTVDAETDASATTRWSVTDVLHSSPAVITYGGASDDDGDGLLNETGDDATKEFFFDRLVVGTNEGGLRFINGTTGNEEWMFLPEALHADIRNHFSNPEGNHLYGLDVTPSIRVIDNDSDGIIEPGTPPTGEPLNGYDKVYVYIAMRAGGSYIYALDVTPAATLANNTTAIVPKFLWRIKGGSGGTTGFGRMGDSWSQPRLASIAVTSGSDIVTKDVLIFGGGYDSALDSLDNSGVGPNYNFGLEAGTPNMGNAVYIVDADTGALIFNISHAASTSPVFAAASDADADIKVPNMFYSIPSRITILDTNGDGADDRLYFGDTAGQVWRVDLADNVKTSGTAPEGDSIVGRLAKLSTAGTATEERRFFEPPAVVQVTDTNFSNIANGEYDYVMIGSGNRGHPLNSDAHDRFYALRDKYIDGMPVATAGDNLANAAAYPQTDASDGAIIDSDLIDITTKVFDVDDSDTTIVADLDQVKQSLGWYFDFETGGTEGEKVLSGSTAIAGSVFFTTYEPSGSSSDPCSANVGGGSAYNFDILNTKASVDWDEDGNIEDQADRSRTLGGGIPSDVVPVFTKEGVVGIVGIEGGAAQLGTLTGLPRYRTYWYEED